MKIPATSKIKWNRRSETLLRRAWDANVAAMGPASASACVARNADAWVSRLVDHVSRGSKSKEVLNSLEVVGKGGSLSGRRSGRDCKNNRKIYSS